MDGEAQHLNRIEPLGRLSKTFIGPVCLGIRHRLCLFWLVFGHLCLVRKGFPESASRDGICQQTRSKTFGKSALQTRIFQRDPGLKKHVYVFCHFFFECIFLNSVDDLTYMVYGP